MAARNLPDQSNFEQLKKQAKDLLKAYRSGDPEATADFSVHPREISAGEAKLADAQLVLSRHYGFDSWPKLRKEVAGRQLRSAIWGRDLKSTRLAIEEEPSALNERGPHPRFGGEPAPIQIAAERGDRQIVELLLDSGADPDGGIEGYGWSALQLAAHWGHTHIAELLIDRGAAVDIFTCVLLGDVDRATALLSVDSSLATASGLSGAPPLHQATSPEIARLLVDHGAPLDTVDANGNTPLASAIGRGDRSRSVAQFLFEKGSPADPCLVAALGKYAQLSDLIQSDPEAVRFIGNIGLNAVSGTPLHAACHHGHQLIVELLLESDADPNARADSGQTPLHLCGDAGIARLLVEAGADPNAVDDEHGTMPLTWAKVSIDIHGSTSTREELVAYLKAVTQRT